MRRGFRAWVRELNKLERRLEKAYEREEKAQEALDPRVIRAMVKKAIAELDKWCNEFCQEDSCYYNCPIAEAKLKLKELNKRYKKLIRATDRIFNITTRMLTLQWRDVRTKSLEDEIGIEEVLDDGEEK